MYTGFASFFRNKFAKLFQGFRKFFFSRIHNAQSVFLACWIFPYDCSSMSFKKTLFLAFTDFQDFPGPPRSFKAFPIWKMLVKD